MNTLNKLYQSKQILLECISGSKAYGLDTTTSDTDIRGVFILPKKQFYGLHFIDQIADDKNDIVFYELKKLMDLLSKNNPNILELISTPIDCIKYKHPVLYKLKPEIFISKLCMQSFCGYAIAQIQKARGFNKKILNPIEKYRKGLFDFCWVATASGSIGLHQWLQDSHYDIANCGCASIDHMKNCYLLYTGGHYTGIMDKDNVQIVSSSIPKNDVPITMFYCNIEGFQKHCIDYKQYWHWVDNRNEHRYNNTLEHGKNYDAKNMMHTFRLLNMAYEIAIEYRINVRRSDREYLLKIRMGELEYDDLVLQANEKMMQVKDAFAICDLPDEPNSEIIENLLVEIREEIYSKNIGN